MVFEERGVKKLSAAFTPVYAICDFSFVLQNETLCFENASRCCQLILSFSVASEDFIYKMSWPLLNNEDSAHLRDI